MEVNIRRSITELGEEIIIPALRIGKAQLYLGMINVLEEGNRHPTMLDTYSRVRIHLTALHVLRSIRTMYQSSSQVRQDTSLI